MTNTPAWTRSSECGSSTCVEVALVDGEILIRDSKNPDQPHLTVSRADWAGFLARIVDGEYPR